MRRPWDQVDDLGLLKEEELQKGLSHPNLCQLHASGRLNHHGKSYAYLEFEFVSGETLSRHLQREALLPYDVKEILCHLLQALEYLHGQPTPLIHGEVTLENVFLDLTQGWSKLRLIDFGAVHRLGDRRHKPNLNLQPHYYLAPESFNGVSSVSSDLYAVGVLGYQLLFKHPPFIPKGKEDVDTLLQLRESFQLPEASEISDQQLLACIEKALSFQADERFESAKAFRLALQGNPPLQRKRLSSSLPSEKNRPLTPQAPADTSQGFAAIAGMDELKSLLREEVISPLHSPEEYERYGISIPNGMLLYGPPGCGKTFFAKHFVEEVGFHYLCITPSSLKSRYVNATGENIAKLFEEAAENAPTIIFIDEINELIPNREDKIHEMSRSTVNEMLAQMDRTGEKGIFIIGATNYPHMIDPAMLRAGRLEKLYYIGPPDTEGRKALFKLELENRPYDFGLNYDLLAEQTKDYISADIKVIVNEAARSALKQKTRITMQALLEAIHSNPPSLSREELVRYEEIHRNVEASRTRTPSSKTEEKRPIGFK